MIDAVIFDMDGVLADSEPLHQHVIRALLAEYGVDWAPDGRDPTVCLTSLAACVVIEDSERGVSAARAAGMRCVAIPCGETRHHDFADATLVLSSLPDLLACSLFA